jgi:hypothetical protein
MIITTKKAKQCRSWAYADDARLSGTRRYRMRCQREAGHQGNHITIDATTSWGPREKRRRAK